MNKQDVLSRLKEHFPDNLFEIKEQEQLLSDSWRVSRIDYVVYQKVKISIKDNPENNKLIEDEETILSPFCVILSTSESLSSHISLRYARQIIKRIISDSAFWLGVVLDKEINIFTTFENPSGSYSWKKCTLEKASSIIDYFKSHKFSEDQFRESLFDIIDNLKEDTKSQKSIIEILKENVKEVQFIQYGRNISIPLIDQFTIVSSIMKKLNIRPTKKLCRYTSASSLHRIISSQVESMCGLAVMNDKSEGFYLDTCISSSASYNIWTRPQYEVDEFNKAYITSLCDIGKSDDLTMWRLYGGEDGDGVCLEYDIDDNIIKNSTYLLLMPVMYGKNNNPIIQLFRLVNKIPIINGFQFVLSYKSIFRYFVKPDGFKIEEEYRLLLLRHNSINSKLNPPKWIFNPSYKIFHPIQELDLPSSIANKIKSPLILKRIILGPKCKEANVNKVQLRAWLNQIGMSGISVEESSITFYR